MARKRLKNWEGLQNCCRKQYTIFPTGFEEPAMRAEIIPERETESLNRLPDS